MLTTSPIITDVANGHWITRIVFPLTIFMSAVLLFVMQPIAAKVLLPVFGGTPAVWTVCMLFFQTMLLFGYAYAWCLSRFKGTMTWRTIHLLMCIVSLSALPVHLTPVLSATDPAFLILKTLLYQLGLPILIVSSSAPLLQFAFSRTHAKKAPDPYFLYVASNVGSLLALLSYPWIIERTIGIGEQFYYWNTIYIAYIAFITALIITVRYLPNLVVNPVKERLNIQLKTTWIGLSFIPCSLMLGVTFYISTDIAATPLFWVIPLALYLLSFIITFAAKPWIQHSWVVRNTPIAFVFLIISFMFGANRIPAGPLIITNLICFFMIALLCHGNLVQKRPAAQSLTSFYLCLAIGGLLAGLLNGLIAPRLFSHAYEYPLIVLLATVCCPNQKQRHQWLTPFVVLSLLAVSLVTRHIAWLQSVHDFHLIEIVALTLIMIRPGSNICQLTSLGMLFAVIFLPKFSSDNIIDQQRNFYGIKRVFSQNNAHYLMSQSTLHGFQVQSGPDEINGAIAYYGPVSSVVRTLQSHLQPVHATILGLGAGTLLCQFKPDDEVNLIEIDEQVIQIASNPALFTNLHKCPANARIIHQDGRLAVKNLLNASSDLLIMDAFSSDAIPVHLLTLEAFSLYQKKLTSNGAILINISNRHLNVLPVITAAAHQLNLIMLHQHDAGNTQLGQFPSQWVLLTRSDQLANEIMHVSNWHFVTNQTSMLWTDDYSNIIPLLMMRS